jgi:hypothetical protein
MRLVTDVTGERLDTLRSMLGCSFWYSRSAVRASRIHASEWKFMHHDCMAVRYREIAIDFTASAANHMLQQSVVPRDGMSKSKKWTPWKDIWWCWL